jgi:hypothetical protein
MTLTTVLFVCVALFLPMDNAGSLEVGLIGLSQSLRLERSMLYLFESNLGLSLAIGVFPLNYQLWFILSFIDSGVFGDFGDIGELILNNVLIDVF